MNKKILIHSIVFSPDGVSTAYLYNDIALKFKERGYDVSVLTTTPHYNRVESEIEKQPLTKKALGLYYESDYQGIKVKHVYQKKYKTTLLRLVGFIYWHIVSFFLGLAEKNVSIILSPSPPLTIGILNIWIGKLKRAKVVYNVQEIYPDLLIEEGDLGSQSIISILKWFERYVYNQSDAVTTIDEVFYKTIVERFKDNAKLHIIPNFVDTDLYRPCRKCDIHLDKSIFPDSDNLKLMYAGNVGYAQDWSPLIAIAEKLKNEPVEFFVIGEGVMKSFLQNEKRNKGLSKLHILPYQPREIMPQLLAYSDLQFVFMSPETEGHGFPSKVYTIMACARPLLVCSGEKTPIINFLKDKNCSYPVTTRDFNVKTEELLRIIRNILLDKKSLIRKGENGYVFISEYYSSDVVTDKYIELANTLLK